MSTLLANARPIKLHVRIDPDRWCETRGCKIPAPAPGPRLCPLCLAIEAVAKHLRRAAEAGDYELVGKIVEAAQEAVSDDWMARQCGRRRVAAVRTAPHPIIGPDDDDEFDDDGPSAAAVGLAEYNEYMSREL